jgi:hypothetical protein
LETKEGLPGKLEPCGCHHGVGNVGWVRRDPDPADGRGVVVSLTEAGRRRALEVVSLKTDVEKRVFDVLDPEALDIMNDALRRVTDRLQATNDVASPSRSS